MYIFICTYVHITPHESKPIAECLGWATLSGFEIHTKVHMKRVFPIAQYYTQDSSSGNTLSTVMSK